MKYTIKRDAERYGNNTGGSKHFPDEFTIEGVTEEQADEICYALSWSYDAGLDDQYYVMELRK